jgi:hypothetical protein
VRHNITNKRLLYLGRPEVFPLYGPGYTNLVYPPDEGDLMQQIQNQRIEYVVGFVTFERHGAKGENWVYTPSLTKKLRQLHPDKFQLLYASEGSEVMRVLE